MVTKLRLAKLLITMALITVGGQFAGQVQTEVRKEASDAGSNGAEAAQTPQSPEKAIEALMLAARDGSDARFVSLLPDSVGEAFGEAQKAARAQNKACERLAKAMNRRGFGKEGEDLANAILRPSPVDRWKEWKKLKIVNREEINDRRVLLTVEWTRVEAEAEAESQVSEIKFLSVRARDGWRLLPDAFEPDEQQLAMMKSANEATEQATAELNKLANDVEAGKLATAHQVEEAVLKIGSRPRAKPARPQQKKH
jgi:hypothetical protein